MEPGTDVETKESQGPKASLSLLVTPPSPPSQFHPLSLLKALAISLSNPVIEYMSSHAKHTRLSWTGLFLSLLYSIFPLAMD